MAKIRTSFKNFFTVSRAPWAKRFGLFGQLQTTPTYDPLINLDYAQDNNFALKAQTAAETGDKELLRLDTADTLRLGGECLNPMAGSIVFNLTTSSSQASQQFFIAPFPMQITSISEIHSVANGATMTAYVEKLISGKAVGSGVRLMTNTFNMNGTAQTQQTGSLPTQYPASSQTYGFSNIILKTGDRIALVLSTTVTSLAGVQISMGFIPGAKAVLAVYNMNANAGLVDTQFFLALQDMTLTAAYASIGTAGTNGSAVNVQLTKDTSTNAPGAGTDILTNNTDAGFNMKATINTIETGTLTATAATLRFAPGNRLSCDFAGTLTALAGVVLVAVFNPIYDRKFISIALQANAAIVDQQFFTADRGYYIEDAMAVWSTAAASGNIQLTRDTGTDAPGAGTDLLSMDTNAGWQVDGTAQTPERATFINTQNNHLLAGDRLSLDMNVGANIVGFLATVALSPE